MGFTVYRAGDLSTNERIIAFYKKELWASHILDTAKKQLHYGTKWYRKFIGFDFPGSRRYRRMKALVSNSYRQNKFKYGMLSRLGKRI